MSTTNISKKPMNGKRSLKVKAAVIAAGILLLSGVILWFRGLGPGILSSSNFETFKFFSGGESGQSQTPAASDLSQTHTHPGLGFSFRYPDGFKISSTAEELGETILVQKEGGGAKEGFQIFISEFDEPGPITGERIKIDLPEIVIEQPQDIELGIRNQESGIGALIFFSQDESFGKTREVWFVHKGFLYQVTSKAEFDNQLSQIMATWRFR